MFSYGKSLEEQERRPLSQDFLPTKSGYAVRYPDNMRVPVERPIKTSADPWSYLGPIGYTGNTWRARKGELNTLLNIHMGFHVKKTVIKELARRLVLTESKGGLPEDIDDDSFASTAEAYYLDDDEYDQGNIF